MALTDTAVRQAKPKDKGYTLADGDGLALFVHPRGGKYWHLYRANERQSHLARRLLQGVAQGRPTA